jgi:hypothetical protein
MINATDIEKMGFRINKKSGAHTARTMMLEELKVLMLSRPESASLEDYRVDVEEFNILHKPTENSRRYTFKPLTTLYGLSMGIPIFNVFRIFWDLDESSQSILALQLAVARDPYLYLSASKMMNMQYGELFIKSEMEEVIAAHYIDKFSPSTLASLVRNISSTWTQAGYLEGKAKKYRAQPKATYVNLAYALFLAHCHGLSGQRMFDSFWCQMLSQDKEHLFELAHRASLRGLINFKQISEVIEVTFPNIELPKVAPQEGEE